MLDLLANRCLASRTNAWTAVDHTCYTVYTAGTSGFLQILPIYLDHILFPNLRKEDFATEVHHISGRGRSDISFVKSKSTDLLSISVKPSQWLAALGDNCDDCRDAGVVYSEIQGSKYATSSR